MSVAPAVAFLSGTETTKEAMKSGAYRYAKLSANGGKLEYFNQVSGSETCSGAVTLTFTSRTAGTLYDIYSGSYSGYFEGTFKILAMDVIAPPIASARTVQVKMNQNKKFLLPGKAMDVGMGALKYVIVSQPDVGKLIIRNLPEVIYQPKSGFTGTVKFKHLVKEGNIASKPVIITLVVK
ncbi:MAG: Ig-like domain-containing protein [Verrucomicrobiota bacterium]